MPVQVLFFASAREAAGVSQAEVELNGDTMSSEEVVSVLITRFPKLESVLQACVLALNQEYLEKGSTVELRDNDELAIIPPLSGG